MVGQVERIRAAICAAGVWLLGQAVAPFWALPVMADERGEHEVKAAFIYNFAKFVDWPEAKMVDDKIFLCVVGADYFGGELEATVHAKTVRGRRLVVERLQAGDDLQHCHILFVGRTEVLHPALVMEDLRAAHVLTVGDSEEFALRGGMINFRMEERKVRFEINPAAADDADLRISSQLLKLAVRLVGEPPAGE
jgi:hypothetical protein